MVIMIIMVKTKDIGRSMIELRTTTLSIRLGTKYQLDDYREKGESYDDALMRLLNEVKGLRVKNTELENEVKLNVGDIPNKITAREFERGLLSINIRDRTIIPFSYNKPAMVPTADGYTMEIEIGAVHENGNEESFEDRFPEPGERATLRLHLIAEVIRKNFDPTFILSGRKNIIDPEYWKSIYRRAGIPWSSYHEDVQGILDDYEGEMREMRFSDG